MADVIKYRFVLRRGLAADWTAKNEVLLQGEIGLELDSGLGKVGDGSTAWNSLPYTIVGQVDLSGLSDGKCLAWDESAGLWKVATRGVSYIPGTGISIDDTDPEAPVINSNLSQLGLDDRKPTYSSITAIASPAPGMAVLCDADGLVYIYSSTAGWPASGAGVAIMSSSFLSAPGATPSAGTAASLPSKPSTWMELTVGGQRMFVPAYVALLNNYWRLKITANNGATLYVTALEIEMASTSGGPNLCTGGRAYATSEANASNPATGAFDGNKGTGEVAGSKWASSSAPSTGSPQCIGYQLATGATVNSVRLWGCISGQTTLAPRDFVVQHSTNSTTGLDGTWTDEWSVTGQTGWTAGEVRTFDRP